MALFRSARILAGRRGLELHKNRFQCAICGFQGRTPFQMEKTEYRKRTQKKLRKVDSQNQAKMRSVSSWSVICQFVCQFVCLETTASATQASLKNEAAPRAVPPRHENAAASRLFPQWSVSGHTTHPQTRTARRRPGVTADVSPVVAPYTYPAKEVIAISEVAFALVVVDFLSMSFNSLLHVALAYRCPSPSGLHHAGRHSCLRTTQAKAYPSAAHTYTPWTHTAAHTHTHKHVRGVPTRQNTNTYTHKHT